MWERISARWSATRVTRNPRPHRNGARGKRAMGSSSLIAVPSKCTKPALTITAHANPLRQPPINMPILVHVRLQLLVSYRTSARSQPWKLQLLQRGVLLPMEYDFSGMQDPRA